jgi:hypothetical protein
MSPWLRVPIWYWIQSLRITMATVEFGGKIQFLWRAATAISRAMASGI